MLLLRSLPRSPPRTAAALVGETRALETSFSERRHTASLVSAGNLLRGAAARGAVGVLSQPEPTDQLQLLSRLAVGGAAAPWLPEATYLVVFTLTRLNKQGVLSSHQHPQAWPPSPPEMGRQPSVLGQLPDPHGENTCRGVPASLPPLEASPPQTSFLIYWRKDWSGPQAFSCMFWTHGVLEG